MVAITTQRTQMVKTLAQFIAEARAIHGDVYNYDEAVYVNSHTKLVIICPIHGRFNKTPAKHVHSKQGCPKCSRAHTVDRFVEFANKAFHKYGNDITIVPSVVPCMDTPITAICTKHGEFSTTFTRLLSSKYGCQVCAIASAATTKTSSLTDFIAKARKVHGDTYSYDNAVYTSAKDKIIITCKVHGDFSQLVSGHLAGYGCKLCSNYGKGRVDANKPCTLYYFNIIGTNLYKIGITTRSIEERYRSKFDRDQINVIFTKHFDTGLAAYEYEQSLLSEYNHLKYTGDKVLASGNTEIFVTDVFNGKYPI